MVDNLRRCMIYNFSFYPIDSRMYLIMENEDALIIDPCVSDDALELIKKNNVKKATVLLTHEHYDHISGVNWVRENIKMVNVCCSEKCSINIQNPAKNLSSYWDILFINKDNEVKEYIETMKVLPYTCEADSTYNSEKTFEWNNHSIYMKETPGHSKGSSCIIMDKMILFSGDSLVTGYETITRLPGGSKKDYEEITKKFIKSLDKDILVYPGHGRIQKLNEYNLL